MNAKSRTYICPDCGERFWQRRNTYVYCPCHTRDVNPYKVECDPTDDDPQDAA